MNNPIKFSPFLYICRNAATCTGLSWKVCYLLCAAHWKAKGERGSRGMWPILLRGSQLMGMVHSQEGFKTISMPVLWTDCVRNEEKCWTPHFCILTPTFLGITKFTAAHAQPSLPVQQWQKHRAAQSTVKPAGLFTGTPKGIPQACKDSKGVGKGCLK